MYYNWNCYYQWVKEVKHFQFLHMVALKWAPFVWSCMCVWGDYLITVVVQQALLSSGSERWATCHRDDATPWSPLIGWNEDGLWCPQTVWAGCRQCTQHPRRSGARVGWAEWCAQACCSCSALDKINRDRPKNVSSQKPDRLDVFFSYFLYVKCAWVTWKVLKI